MVFNVSPTAKVLKTNLNLFYTDFYNTKKLALTNSS